MPPLSPLLPAAPPALAAFAFAVIYGCFRLSVSRGHHTGIVPISFFTYRYPERELGRVGFVMVSALFALLARPIVTAMEKAVERKLLGQVRWIKRSSHGAFAGLAVVGLIPLQADILQVQSGLATLSMQSIVHQAGAVAFFVFSVCNAQAVLSLMQTTRSYFAAERNRASVRLKVGTLSLCALPLLPSLILHPASGLAHWVPFRWDDLAGLSQWSVVGALVLFWSTYALELRAIVR